MVSANQINGVEKMTDRPDISPSEMKLINKVLRPDDGPIETALKKYWNDVAKQTAAFEKGKVIPR